VSELRKTQFGLVATAVTVITPITMTARTHSETQEIGIVNGEQRFRMLPSSE
jgi:Skp family chaperone for outer membrane proteins